MIIVYIAKFVSQKDYQNTVFQLDHLFLLYFQFSLIEVHNLCQKNIIFLISEVISTRLQQS